MTEKDSKIVRLVITTDAVPEVPDAVVDDLLLRAGASSMEDALDGISAEGEDAFASDELLESVLSDTEPFSPGEIRELGGGMRPSKAPGSRGPVTLYTFGRMSLENGNVVIRYNESDLLNLAGSRTQFSFALDEPSVVTMARTGTAHTALVFDGSGARRVCCYNSIIPFEIAVTSERFRNTVTFDEGRGIIEASYSVETKGTLLERSYLRVRVEKSDVAF